MQHRALASTKPCSSAWSHSVSRTSPGDMAPHIRICLPHSSQSSSEKPSTSPSTSRFSLRASRSYSPPRPTVLSPYMQASGSLRKSPSPLCEHASLSSTLYKRSAAWTSFKAQLQSHNHAVLREGVKVQEKVVHVTTGHGVRETGWTVRDLQSVAPAQVRSPLIPCTAFDLPACASAIFLFCCLSH